MRTLVFTLAFALLAIPVWADTNLVSEDFESYANTAEMQVVWGVSGNETLETDPNVYAGQEGNAAYHNGDSGVNEYANLPTGIAPTETKSYVLGYDIFDNGQGNSRMTLGFRHTDEVRNLLEMGFWNTEGPAYAYRLTNWWGSGDTGWNYATLNPDFDVDFGGGANGIVNPADIASYALSNGLDMWHRWEATITSDSVTITLDLFRDGLTNDPNDPNASVAGVDFSMTHTDVMAAGYEFQSLRFGGASGLTSTYEALFDNITLDEITSLSNADFDGDGLVGGDDFIILQQNFGLSGFFDNSGGDANGDGIVTDADLAIWKAQYGGPPPSAVAPSAAAVPEPTTACLGLLAALGFGLLTNRRRNG